MRQVLLVTDLEGVAGVDRMESAAPNPMAIRVEWQAFGRPLSATVGSTAAVLKSHDPVDSAPLAVVGPAESKLVID